jgi:hypothetical protein
MKEGQYYGWALSAISILNETKHTDIDWGRFLFSNNEVQ